ncbi:MAG TPA: molybdopterin biosynthesis protein MoeB, partial [Chloroflexi bacterium]|nr:molybdopterin biosynthesis protein MoeB [Chloroflexota bacterium]
MTVYQDLLAEAKRKVQEVSVAEAVDEIEGPQKPHIIDVREKSEW